MPSAAIMRDGAFTAYGLYPGVPVVLTVFDDYAEVGGAVRLTPELDRNPEVMIRLEPTARVIGRVLTPDGKPTKGASVYLSHVPLPGGTTGPEGRFDLPAGMPGLPCAVSARLWSSADRKLLLTGTSKTMEVASGQKVVDVGDIVLAPWKEPPPE